MAEPRFVAWGELLWDVFPDRRRLGGAPANAAYHAACFGARSTLVSRVGNDPLGQAALRELTQLGMDTSAIQRDEQAATGTVQVEFVAGEPRYEIAMGTAWGQISWCNELANLMAAADVVCFGTLAQTGPHGFATLRRALSWAPRALRICDLNLREPLVTPTLAAEAISLASVVKLNEAEVAQLSGWFGQTDLVSWLLRERGIKAVAVTRGARGASLALPGQLLEHPGVPLSSTAGDPVGAGDAFGAALSVGLAQGQTAEASLANANRYAAHVASQSGGMPPRPEWLASAQNF